MTQEIVSTKDQDYKDMNRLVKDLLKGAFNELKRMSDEGPALMRAEGDVTLVMTKNYQRGGRFAWNPLYAGYYRGKKVAEQTGKPSDNFVRALVRAQRRSV